MGMQVKQQGHGREVVCAVTAAVAESYKAFKGGWVGGLIGWGAGGRE